MMPRLIPCLDVDGGIVVKGTRFQGLRAMGDPVDLALRYEDDGADELVLLDISATVEARAHGLAALERVAARLAIPLTVGGGVTSLADARRLLAAGADKVAVNSAGVAQPTLLADIAAALGRQALVAAIDVTYRGPDYAVMTHGGRRDSGRTLTAWLCEVQQLGAGEVLLTSIDRDGSRSGYDLALLRQAAAQLSVPLIASGGAASARHLVEAQAIDGVTGLLIAGVLHDGTMRLSDLKAQLATWGVTTRGRFTRELPV